MKLVYLGSGEFGIGCLDGLADSDHHLSLIVTQPPRSAGRGRKLSPTPVADWASARSTPFVETDNVNAPDAVETIAAASADVVVVIAFGQKIGKELISLPPKGAINVHASLLPQYRGAAPINWAIVNGETRTGISIIALADTIDAGDILSQCQTEIGPDETAGQLHDRLARMAAPLLLETLSTIEAGAASYIRQDDSQATLAPKLTKSDGLLDFNEPAELLARKIRGFWPWPGASADYLSKRTKRSARVTISVAEVVTTSNPGQLPPGTLDENLNVICGTDSLRIRRIKPAGSAVMDFTAFVNGRQTESGDMFVKIGR